MPKSIVLKKDLSLDFNVNCWYSMIGSLFNPFCYDFSYALKSYVVCNHVQFMCLFNQIEGFCDGLSNVKCPKAQLWGNKLLQMWEMNKKQIVANVVSLHLQILKFISFKDLPCNCYNQFFGQSNP